MRISTQMMFEAGATRLMDLQTSMAKTQTQIASGRRILSPSDDPVNSARALEVTQAQSLNTQYARNREYARSALTEAEGVMGSMTELVQVVKETAISAGNPLLSDADRNGIATGLQARFDQLLGWANTKDAQGNYLFSGFQTNTPAFAATAAGATYQGDTGTRLIQVDDSRQMAASVSGQSVFQGGGQDVFKTIKDLITLLQTPGTAGLSAGLTTANTNLKLALDNVSTVRAAVGSRLNEIDALNIAGDDRDLQYAQALSGLQDLDYTQALTELSKQQFTLEAAQKSFAKVSGMSLFNYV